MVETKDDRSLSGFLVDRDNRDGLARQGEDIRLRASEIKVQPAGRSLMPEGVEGLDEKQLRDLFAYLHRSRSQLT